MCMIFLIWTDEIR